MIISASTSLTTWFEGIALLPNETLPEQSQKRPDNTGNMVVVWIDGFYITVVYIQHIHTIVAIFWDWEQTQYQNLVFMHELVCSKPPPHLLHWLLMSKSEAVFIPHSRTWCDLGKREGSCAWCICVLFHRWEEWWMDEVYSHCNGTLVYHGRGGRRKGVFEKNQIQPLQSGLPKWIPDNISLLCFHDKPAGLGWGGGVGGKYENWELKAVGGGITCGGIKGFFCSTKNWKNKNLVPWAQIPSVKQAATG